MNSIISVRGIILIMGLVFLLLTGGSGGFLQARTADTADYEAFLLAFFRVPEEEMYYAVSRDGLNWEELNQRRPVLTATKGNQSIRDPHILRDEDGVFRLVSTNSESWTSVTNKILIWDSRDLINWENERLIEISFTGARNAWAPESIYCSQKESYLVFWASAEYPGWDHRMYYAETDDFEKFSEPQIFLDPGYPVIDSTLVKKEGVYYHFLKDEREDHPDEKSIRWTYSEHGAAGPWAEFNDKPLSEPLINHTWVEGPTVFFVPRENKWYMYYDEYTQGRWGLHQSEDISSGDWEQVPYGEFDIPHGARHGSVLPLTEKEYQQLIEEFGS